MNKNLLVIILASVLVTSVFLFRLESAGTSSPSISDRLGLAANFLENLYNGANKTLELLKMKLAIS
jgi:hypothetical protein